MLSPLIAAYDERLSEKDDKIKNLRVCFFEGFWYIRLCVELIVEKNGRVKREVPSSCRRKYRALQ